MTTETKLPTIDEATEQMLLDVAVDSLEEGIEDFTKPQVFFAGDEELPAKMIVTRTQGDYIDVYHTQTGQKSTILKYMLRNQMMKRLPDGSRAFSLNPTKTPTTGRIKCWFHPLSPERVKLAKLGLDHIVCNKSNIRSRFDLRGHMSHRHHEEYAAIQEEEQLLDKEEEKRFIRAQMAVLTGQPQPEEFSNDEYEIVNVSKRPKKRSPVVTEAIKMSDDERKAWGKKMREAKKRKARERGLV